MNPLLEQKLGKVESQWKWLKFGQHLGTLGAVFCLLWFLIQGSVWREWITSRGLIIFISVLFVLAAILSLIVLVIFVMSRRSSRIWTAGVMEKSMPDLMDRVNTLVYLEGKKLSDRPLTLAAKIQKQAAGILTGRSEPYPFSPERTFAHLGIFLIALAGVIFFQVHFAPFSKLKKADATAAQVPKADSVFELKAGDAVEGQEKKTWGEVRIIEPGRDLKMTKVDVVPLQIEMAASDAMEKPAWVSNLNGGEDTVHELAAPAEPNYAVYQPMIYLDELKVSDWDVVSYFARVTSCAPAEYTSKIYFIEIRPFRDDILKMTGGGEKGDKAYDLLNEITGLVKKQTELLQQTHQHQQIVYAKEELRTQDRKKLAEAEKALRDATDQLYGKIAAEQENAPVGDILDHLAAAGQHMDKGAEALRDDAVPEGKQREQKALAELVEARKTFQKVMNENPGAFGSDQDDDGEEDPITVADSQKALQQVSEMRNREQTALDSMRQLTAQQKALAEIARTRLQQTDGSATTAKAQSDLKKRLEDLIQKNPDLFRGTGPEQEAVRENMDEAIQSLENDEQYSSRRSMTRSAETLGDLQKVVEKNHQMQQVAQAYELKKIIDQNVKQLNAEEANPGGLSNEEAKALAESAQRSTGALKEIAEASGGSGMGPELGEALTPENQEALREALEKFAQSPSKEGRQGPAGEAGKNLAKVSEAFDQSRPGMTKQARGQDSLQSQGGDALGQAEQQLRSLLMAQQQKKPISPENESKALAEIMRLLKIEPPSKETEAAQAMMVSQVEKMMEKGKGMAVDPEALKKLLDEIEAVRLEIKDKALDRKPDEAGTVVDPSKFPPSYRERIKRYFEQLSATPP